ncbi:unnamed protein product [Chondrus crispus]|uniref:Uncharacterized protein n=1 Tax=Chondrus crispus TaxID=2769 RepID=R7QJS4_CHOCR|nr:unnamed protein product [Chondrus crispus]CDF38777.1 unnamed protein product [Chondrus crispus]|eukprot:XP_005718682.1 unnamed protein product [Chondrus crispus]
MQGQSFLVSSFSPIHTRRQLSHSSFLGNPQPSLPIASTTLHPKTIPSSSPLCYSQFSKTLQNMATPAFAATTPLSATPFTANHLLCPPHPPSYSLTRRPRSVTPPFTMQAKRFVPPPPPRSHPHSPI